MTQRIVDHGISEPWSQSAANRRPLSLGGGGIEIMEGLIQRAVEPWARELLATVPILTIEGARQTGKSTLAAMLTQNTDALTLSLDERDSRVFAEQDPKAFVEQAAGRLLVIDESRTRLFRLGRGAAGGSARLCRAAPGRRARRGRGAAALARLSVVGRRASGWMEQGARYVLQRTGVGGARDWRGEAWRVGSFHRAAGGRGGNVRQGRFICPAASCLQDGCDLLPHGQACLHAARRERAIRGKAAARSGRGVLFTFHTRS